MLRFEVLQAQEGDCFIMRWGPTAPKYLAVIDGGPKASDGHKAPYLNLKRRLDELKGGDDILPIDWMMVSHIDDDHINGLLKLVTSLRDTVDHNETPPYEIRNFWFNAFEELADVSRPAAVGAQASIASLGGDLPAGLSHHTQAVMASVNQGRNLRDALDSLEIDVNAPIGGLLKSGVALAPIGGLKVTVVGPRETELEQLRTDWINTKPRTAAAAAYADKSIANLSSIVCHVAYETGGKTRTLLLTGDARGDYLLDGLEDAGLLSDGKIKVDLFKVQHHGSDRNATVEFFKAVIADHYVISANGKHDNPDRATLEWILEARGDDDYTLHISNELPWMEDFFATRRHGRPFKVVYRGRPDDDISIDEINLD